MLYWQLKQRQSLPLEVKIEHSKLKIREWYEYWEGQVYISFSGGKDSIVLLDLVREMYPDVPAVFIDTGLEFPEVRQIVKNIENVIWLKPKMSFKQIIEKYGYPVVSKEQAQYIEEVRNTKSEKLKRKRLENSNYSISSRWKYLIDAPFKISPKCCHYLKKEPVKAYEKKYKRYPFVGTKVEDSNLRKNTYLKTGCNVLKSERPVSKPLSIWTNNDVWNYIKLKNLAYPKVYDMGYKSTGCIFCCFGVHLEKNPNRFELLKLTHPKLYDYCLNKLNLNLVLSYLNLNF